MKHIPHSAMSRGAIELKGDDDDPVSIVTKSIENMQKAVDDRLKKIEEKGETVGDDKELKALQDRLDKLEAKGNRPGGTTDPKEAEQVETKALATLLRTGTDAEIKAAATDNNVEGGYFVLPTVDLTIRNLMTDLSPRNPARPCEQCGKRFRPTNPDAKYCSHRCSTDATVLPDKPCAQCGTTFHPSTIGTQYCSTSCRDASMRTLPIKECENPACGKPFQAQHYAHQKYCSMACKQEHRRTTAPVFENECVMCGSHFTSRHHPAILCSQKCKTRKSQASRGVFPKSLRPWVFDYILTEPINASRPAWLTAERFDEMIAA